MTAVARGDLSHRQQTRFSVPPCEEPCVDRHRSIRRPDRERRRSATGAADRRPRSPLAGTAGPPGRRRGARRQRHAADVHRERRRRGPGRRRRQPPDRPRLRHRRDRRRARRYPRGRGGRRAGRRLYPHLLHGLALRGLRRGVRGPGPADARRPPEAVGAPHLRRGGRRERGEDRPLVHQAGGRRRLRARVPRPDQPHDGADRQGDAVQARLRAVRPGGLPGADVVSLP